MKKLNIGHCVIFLLGVIVVSFICFMLIKFIFKGAGEIIFSKDEMYVSSNVSDVPLYDITYNENGSIYRGTKVKLDSNELIDEKYYKINYNDERYLILRDNLVKNEDEVVTETDLYVRTALNFYKSNEDIDLIGLIKKGEKVSIIGYDYLTDGKVNMYKIKYNGDEGYVYGKYLVLNEEDALAHYDEEGNYKIHKARANTLLGGSGANLDYYPYEKPKFDDNVMPEEVRSLYMNAGVIGKVDEYIALALKSGINAIVVDIKDNTSPGYPAQAMKKYTKTNYDKALNSYEKYQDAIKKIKDAGLYVIGRITTFKDSYYIKDNSKFAILDNSGNPYKHDGSYWPSAFQRDVWEFNVSLAIESVKEMGFNEIQFDYVRFPDRTGSLEKDGVINFNNPYNEEKAQAIQRFVTYACDEIHKEHAYVSIDVFGESAHTYVTAYGQYWPAISNVADVISGMPYPDHFSKYEYGFKEPVWTIPYELLNLWGESFVSKRQNEIPTPAVVRTWIQTYNAIRIPKIVYDSHMISEQIKGLYDAGLTGGFITWNGSSSLDKYTDVSSAFGKEY